MVAALAYSGGEFGDPGHMRIPFLDRGFMLGDGVYEALRTYGGVPFEVDEHLERLRRSADQLEIPVPWTDQEIGAIVREGIRRLGSPEARVRVWITRGSSAVEYDPPDPPVPPALYASFQALRGVGPDVLEHGVAVITERQDKPESLWQVKTLNGVPAILAR